MAKTTTISNNWSANIEGLRVNIKQYSAKEQASADESVKAEALRVAIKTYSIG